MQTEISMFSIRKSKIGIVRQIKQRRPHLVAEKVAVALGAKQKPGLAVGELLQDLLLVSGKDEVVPRECVCLCEKKKTMIRGLSALVTLRE
jgi:hypothetical protein